MVDLNNVVNHLDKKIAVLEKNASQSKVVEQLKSIRDDIIHSVDVTETGSPEIPVSLAEQTKRGFNQQSKLNWSNPNQGQAQKEAYRSYKGEVETAAETVDPTIANQFKEAKDTYGLLKPIQEAAERRAIQQNQNPIGGFNDMTTAGAGAIAGGPVTAIAAPLARRALAPRIPSMTAVGMDKLANLMERIPSLKNIIEKSPATGQAIMSRLAPEGEDLRTLVPPPPPLSPLQIKSDANLSPSQKGAAMNEINRQKKMMGQ